MVEVWYRVHRAVLAIDVCLFFQGVNQPPESDAVFYPNIGHLFFEAGNAVAAGANFDDKIGDDGCKSLALFRCKGGYFLVADPSAIRRVNGAIRKPEACGWAW